MRKDLTTAALFDCQIPYLQALFARCTYPWEILPEIKACLLSLLEKGLPGYREIQPGVLVGEGVTVAPTATLCGPALIGAGTEIRPGAYLRGNVITGEGCVIGNSSELKNCILLNRAAVPHYNYVGDSILGNGAHMGAGAICSNLKSGGSAVTVHGEEDYPTGLRKVGSFLADGADIGCGCVLNPGTVIGKNTSVYPLTPLRGVYPADSIVKSPTVIVERVPNSF